MHAAVSNVHTRCVKCCGGGCLGSLPGSVKRWVLRCDAAVEGTAFPAICGALYSFYYVYPLDELTRQLPICALEFGESSTWATTSWCCVRL